MNNSIVSENESDDDNSAVMQWILCRKLLMDQMILELHQEVSFRKKRRKNVKRNFEREMQKLNALFEKNDKEFKSQTSVTKPIFKFLLSLLEDSHLELNKLQELNAKNAYGAAIPLSLKLFMTLKILVGDGLLLKIKPETHKSMDLSSAQSLFNRKQYHAVVAQVFCDAWTRIIIEEVCAAGVTHDSQCLRTWNKYMEEFVSEEHGLNKDLYHFILDEAYKTKFI